MESSDDEKELKELSEVYDALKNDAKQIVYDLQGGVSMWREAAAGAVASAGFIVIITIFFLRFSAAQEPAWMATLIVTFWAGVAAMMAAIGAWGFRRYFQLRRKYAGLFRRAKSL